MESKLFQELKIADRAGMLEANCESMEDMTYSKSISQEELEKVRGEFTQLAIEVAALEDQLKEVKEQFAEKLKPMKDEMKESLHILKTRAKEVKERVYVLKDFSEGMIGIYNNRGELISSRRMMAEESQMSINSNLRIAQNS